MEGQTLGDNKFMSTLTLPGYKIFFSSCHHPIQMFKKGTFMAIKQEEIQLNMEPGTIMEQPHISSWFRLYVTPYLTIGIH